MLRKTRKAMTLIELIISMTILATIVSIAVISADDLGEKTRYDETQARAKLIQNAIVGYDTPRFIQDMGRPPVVLVDINESGLDDDEIKARKKLFLAELCQLEDDDELLYSYDNAKNIKRRSYTIATDLKTISDNSSTADDAVDTSASMDFPESITANVGWAGPYAITGLENLTDNWGKPWDIYHYSDNDGDGDGDDTDDYDGVDFEESDLKWATYIDDVDDDSLDDTNDEITLGTQIYGIRSIYSDDYANELAYTFPKDNMYVDELTIKLVDSSGNALDPEAYKGGIRVFIYLPYCPPKTITSGNATTNTSNYPLPKLFEFCAWVRGTSGTETSSEGFRLRLDVDDDSDFKTDDGTTEMIRSDQAIYENFPLIKTRLDTDQTHTTQVVLTNVPVGTRKIWAYAKASDSTTGGTFAPVQNFKITSKDKIIEIRLTQTF